MTNSIDGGGAEQFVGEGIAPFAKVQIAGYDRPFSFVTFGDQVVEVLVLGRAQWFQSEVIDDQQIYLGQGRYTPIIGVGGTGGVELSKLFCLCEKQHVIANTDGTVARS